MATLTPTTLTKDATAPTDLKIASGTAFTDATSLDCVFPQEGKLLLVINSTYAGANSVVIAAGDFIGAGVGNLTVTTAQNGVYYIPISSTRFKTGAAGAGTVNITFGTSNTGFVRALIIP
jgi:hypothetical protein